jgi:hypothetical protein
MICLASLSEDDAWDTCYGNYLTALTHYKRAVAAVGEQIRAGELPTDKQRRGEDAAYDVLCLAREALFNLVQLLPPGD